MNTLKRNALKCCSGKTIPQPGVVAASPLYRFNALTPRSGFTLIELILVLALVVVITSLAAPAMSNFVRGQALGSEARRLVALIHAGQDRAVSEGLPMVLWVNEKEGAYGLQAEMTGRIGDPKAENLALDANLQIAVTSTGLTGTTKFGGLPAIRFLPDGTVD